MHGNEAPRPAYTACPNDSMPVWPSSMLYDSAKMIMMPIWDINVTANPPVKISGSTSMTSTVMLQISQRARLSGL